MTTQTLVTCNGKINQHGFCDKCYQPAYSTSNQCGRLVPYQQAEINTLLAVSGFDWNQYRSTIWLANAHVNDERFLKPEKVGVLVADIKKLLHIIHEAQEAACGSGAVDTKPAREVCIKGGERLENGECAKCNLLWGKCCAELL